MLGTQELRRSGASWHRQDGNLLLRLARQDCREALEALETREAGLSSLQAQMRLSVVGPNEAARRKRKGPFSRLLQNLRNPLVILLGVLAFCSLVTGDARAAAIMSMMIVLGVSLRYYQELDADSAAEKLKALVSTKVSVIRDGTATEVELNAVVPGDILVLSAGDVVAADSRIISSKDLFVNQSALTGESMPAEKHAAGQPNLENALDSTALCFQGTHIESGTAIAVACQTGQKTYFGKLAQSAVEEQAQTPFDVGISKFTWLMIGFIVVMVPLVFVINGVAKHDWLQAFLFALAVGVGLTPEMLPMIVSVNLSKGALVMSRKKVIIKHLDAIQNLGAMDVLCTDKTGTLTQGKVILERHVDIDGKSNEAVLELAFLNSFYQTGLRNMTDVAVLNHESIESGKLISGLYRKIDEIPFDFVRRRMSVIVEEPTKTDLLICKGAVEEVLSLCNYVYQNSEIAALNEQHKQAANALVSELNSGGFRVLALAKKQVAFKKPGYGVDDECDLVLFGFLAFLDPPKESAATALAQLRSLGVQAKVLTGDNEIVTTKICKQVDLAITGILLGSRIESMSDQELDNVVENTNVFAKVSPTDKRRVIASLQRRGRVVGFLGDGINDAPALRCADIGISVDSAVDIARETSDIILLEKSLLVLSDGIVSGRKVFCNITKYIKMAASSNFGNMLSVVGASIFLPFLPMLPVQILTNNLLYDFSQTSIPTDDVDAYLLDSPKKWEIGDIRKFILSIGPISSVFDYATFFTMLYLFGAWTNAPLFQTGWFVESLLTQTLIIHVIRTDRIPFVQSRASVPLTVTTVCVAFAGVYLPFSPLGEPLGFVPLPPLYWPVIVIFLILYVVLTQIIKSRFFPVHAAGSVQR